MKHVISKEGTKTKPYRYEIVDGDSREKVGDYETLAAAMSARRAKVTCNG